MAFTLRVLGMASTDATRAAHAWASRPPASSNPSHSAVRMVMRRSSCRGGVSSVGTSSRIQLYENFISLELLQETQIAALQQADIVYGIAHHGQAGEAQAEGEAVPFL